MSKQDFFEIMDMLGGAYGAKFAQADPTVAKVWYECLQDLQYERLRDSVIQWIQENKFPPTIADLREVYNKTKENSKWQ